MIKPVLFILAGSINFALLLTLVNVNVAQDQLYIYYMYIFSGLWGVSDAVWQSQVVGKKINFSNARIARVHISKVLYNQVPGGLVQQ